MLWRRVKTARRDPRQQDSSPCRAHAHMHAQTHTKKLLLLLDGKWPPFCVNLYHLPHRYTRQHIHTSNYLCVPACVFSIQLRYELLGSGDRVLSFCHLDLQLRCFCSITLKPEDIVTRRKRDQKENMVCCSLEFTCSLKYTRLANVRLIHKKWWKTPVLQYWLFISCFI